MGVATQRERRLLILLAFVSFVVMATEVVPVGIAAVFSEQQGVGAGGTGLLVITYALGVAVGGPLLTLTVVKVDQRLLLTTLIGAFAISQATTAIAPTMPLILAARLTQHVTSRPPVQPEEIRRLLEDKAFDIAPMRMLLGVDLLRGGFGVPINPYTVSMFLTGPLLVVGALVHGDARGAIWGLAALIDLSTPTVLQRKLRNMHLDADHLAERFGLFVLIALGESVVAITSTSAESLDAAEDAARLRYESSAVIDA